MIDFNGRMFQSKRSDSHTVAAEFLAAAAGLDGCGFCSGVVEGLDSEGDGRFLDRERFPVLTGDD